MPLEPDQQLYLTLYGDMSARVMNTLRTLVPDMEVYSIDEAFLALKDFQGDSFARELKDRVRQWTGIPVSVGIGSTKTLAKLANRWAKKNSVQKGVFDITAAENADEILHTIQCEDIWGIGRRTSSKLAKAGIETALDLKNANMAWVRNELGVVGERIARELNGVSCLELEDAPAPKKAIASARSFGHQVTSIEEIQQALSTYIARVAEKLRIGKLLASRIEVFVETNPFKPETPQYYGSTQATFMCPTDSTPELISNGIELLCKIFRPGFQYKKTGVMVTGLLSKDAVQMSLFEDRDERQRTHLQSVVDRLNKKLGQNTVRYASMGMDQTWKMRQLRISKRFTTHWDDLLVVNA